MTSKYTGLTLGEAQKRYKDYITAEEKVLQAQEYELDNRKVTRADLEKIRAGIKYWEKKCEEIGTGNTRNKAKAYRIVAKND